MSVIDKVTCVRVNDIATFVIRPITCLSHFTIIRLIFRVSHANFTDSQYYWYTVLLRPVPHSIKYEVAVIFILFNFFIIFFVQAKFIH